MKFTLFNRVRCIQTILSLLLLICLISSANGETYKWVDEKGVMSFSDDPAAVPARYRKQIDDTAYGESITKPSSISTGTRVTADPAVKETYEYYEIRGLTEKELLQHMNASGITGADGKNYYAYTNWYVRWNYTFSSTPGSCSIAIVATDVAASYKLPKWVSYEDAPADLKNKWGRFIQNLELHEYGHKDIGVQAAKEIERSIAALKARTSCKELGLAANSLGQQILETAKLAEADYDARTRHGRTQGANFP